MLHFADQFQHKQKTEFSGSDDSAWTELSRVHDWTLNKK